MYNHRRGQAEARRNDSQKERNQELEKPMISNCISNSKRAELFQQGGDESVLSSKFSESHALRLEIRELIAIGFLLKYRQRTTILMVKTGSLRQCYLTKKLRKTFI
ncbi:hypothetical protein Nepgr_004797 [Nepenthes gracilis]|uniref:Uncharacterized protein n=1 Tax=Nepenthes gracilis TaxID=150966 RepID=A0AAD3S1Y4_NEPGR|nr:hypothetical protein Nepgr_004797 [Nepenthes gracilis]